MGLIIVDEEKFKKEVEEFHSGSASRISQYALGISKRTGIEAIRQLISQEKEKNDELLREKEQLIKNNNEIQNIINKFY